MVCQLGPECSDVDKLVKMLDAGMNVATLNFAGGDYKVCTIFDLSGLRA